MCSVIAVFCFFFSFFPLLFFFCSLFSISGRLTPLRLPDAMQMRCRAMTKPRRRAFLPFFFPLPFLPPLLTSYQVKQTHSSSVATLSRYSLEEFAFLLLFSPIPPPSPPYITYPRPTPPPSSFLTPPHPPLLLPRPSPFSFFSFPPSFLLAFIPGQAEGNSTSRRT